MHAEEFFFCNMLLDKCLHFINHSVSLLLYLIFQIKDFGSLTLLLTSKGILLIAKFREYSEYRKRFVY